MLLQARQSSLSEQLADFEKTVLLRPENALALWKTAEVLYRIAVSSEDTDEQRNIALKSFCLFQKAVCQGSFKFQTEQIQRILDAYADQFSFIPEHILILMLNAELCGLLIGSTGSNYYLGQKIFSSSGMNAKRF
ncbi:MAG: hypothetical protein CSA22_04730 [Deltaproteobacteria bacterium]|nr:MAG: hypothetical protein CSA22_04730 [Deltaproteobacteria bacterium]